jgi:hypothetical protein
MLGHGGPKVSDIVVGHLETSQAELVDGPADQLGVEGTDAVDHQGEAAGVSHLVSELAATRGRPCARSLAGEPGRSAALKGP